MPTLNNVSPCLSPPPPCPYSSDSAPPSSPSQLLLITGANRALGIDDHFFALGDSLVLTVLGQVRGM